MLKINIDGQEIKAYKGQTILEVAQANGIHIPTLCYDPRVKIYGGCGLCLVEVEGNPKLLRACATEISPGMVITTNNSRIQESRKMTLEFLLSDHIGDCIGPCQKACPANTDVQGYVGLIANQQYREALELIKEKIPLPASIGRVCPHPCETACRRQLVEEPISIAALKYFAADIDLNSEEPFIPEIKPATGKKIAIVGAGPAGLTAAYYLAKEGHQIKVYDAMPQGGGMLRYGIPEYRLPKAILDQEIDLIRNMGVEFIFNTRIGKDLSLDQLINQSDAIFLGIGAWLSSEMRAKGEDLPGVLGGIDFLREVALYGKVQIGDTVAIVGGGNTAMDAARTALRLGASRVMVLYRRTRAEMPAEEIEIIEAEEEGVEFKFLVAPIEVIARDGKAAAIKLQQMELGEPDASGRRSPVAIPGAEETIEVDTIISAIGQKVNLEGLTGIEASKWGSIEVDEATLATNIPGVFAGGDGVTGPKIAVDAIAQGGRAAQSIDAYLKGNLDFIKAKYTAEQKGLTPEDFASYPQIKRAEMPHLKPEERTSNFREVNLGFTEAAAVAEGSRCLECGCKDYFDCRLIKYASEYCVEPQRIEGQKRQEKLIDSNSFIQRNSEKCILCGLCIRICDEVMGVTALGLVHRGFDSIVQPEFNLPLSETPCISCGQCVTVCPTGALMEVFPVTKNVPLQMEETQSVCSFCSVGCEPVFSTKGNVIYRTEPPIDGILCRQGRFGFEAFAKDRINKPMLRRNNTLVEASWAEVLKEAADYTRRIKARYTGSALAVYVSPNYTLEEANSAASFARLALETDMIGSFAPYSSRGLAKIMGGQVPVSSFDELSSTELILLVGSLNRSQVAAVKVREAVKEGARLIVISPEETMVDDIASITIKPQNDNELLLDILAALIKNNMINEDTIAQLVEGYDSFKQILITRAPGEQAQEVAEKFAQAKKAIIIVDGNDVASAGVELLADLAVITGKIGSPRSGIIVVTPGSNHLGLWNLGITASASELKEAIQEGVVKGLFILGEDPVGAGIINAEELKKLEFLITVTPSMTPTAELSDVVLPGSVPVETEGTYVSADKKVRKLTQVVKSYAGLNNQEIINRLAARMNVILGSSQEPKVSLEFNKAVLSIPEDSMVFQNNPSSNPVLQKFLEKIN
ncbi:MAG: molybdopterin-dependent oxidoreductase [Syntrophomonadaceae bacterium]|jgi:formate dehydrogenase major subunit